VCACRRLRRSNWDTINTLQKEVDETVRSKRHNTIERIRSGQLVREVRRISRFGAQEHDSTTSDVPISHHTRG
jgi:hypothetical protein